MKIPLQKITELHYMYIDMDVYCLHGFIILALRLQVATLPLLTIFLCQQLSGTTSVSSLFLMTRKALIVLSASLITSH